MTIAKKWKADAHPVEIAGERYTLNSGIAGGVILNFPPSAVERIVAASSGSGVAWFMSRDDARSLAAALGTVAA